MPRTSARTQAIAVLLLVLGGGAVALDVSHAPLDADGLKIQADALHSLAADMLLVAGLDRREAIPSRVAGVQLTHLRKQVAHVHDALAAKDTTPALAPTRTKLLLVAANLDTALRTMGARIEPGAHRP